MHGELTEEADSVATRILDAEGHVVAAHRTRPECGYAVRGRRVGQVSRTRASLFRPNGLTRLDTAIEARPHTQPEAQPET